jgi:hypothetical protein
MLPNGKFRHHGYSASPSPAPAAGNNLSAIFGTRRLGEGILQMNAAEISPMEQFKRWNISMDFF